MQGALRKKQWIVSFVKHSTDNDENTICIIFQFYNQKLSLEGCCKPYVYKALHRVLYEGTNSFFRRAFYKENQENIISVCFQFYIPKLSREIFLYSLYYMGLKTGCSTKEAIHSLFLR